MVAISDRFDCFAFQWSYLGDKRRWTRTLGCPDPTADFDSDCIDFGNHQAVFRDAAIVIAVALSFMRGQLTAIWALIFSVVWLVATIQLTLLRSDGVRFVRVGR